MCGGCFRTSGVISIPRANVPPIREEAAAAMLIGKTDDRPRPRLEIGARRLLWRSPFVISQFDAPTLPVYNIAQKRCCFLNRRIFI